MAGGGFLVKDWWKERLDEARAVEPVSKLEDSLDWDLAVNNLMMDARAPFIQPSDNPIILKWQLQERRVMEFTLPGAGIIDSGRSDGHIFLVTGMHSLNMSPLFRTPNEEAYIVRTNVNLAHRKMAGDFKRVTRLDDFTGSLYGVFRPFINADKTRYVEPVSGKVRDLDEKGDGNDLSGAKQQVIKYTGFDSRITGSAWIDIQTASVKWGNAQDQAAWDALPSVVEFPELPVALSSLKSAISLVPGFLLPQGATLKDRVMFAIMNMPPLFQTEEGKLVLEAIGLNALSVVQWNELYENIRKPMVVGRQ